MSKYKVGDRFLVRIDKVLHVRNGDGEFDDYIMNAEPPKDRDEIHPIDGCLVTEKFLDQCSLLDTEETSDMGEVSDGYHTFNELYHHRAVLFSVICNQNKELAWKSKKHADGSMFDGMFIVGIKTPDGQATYHYNIEPYWNMFQVKELEYAPEWDGHTPSEAIERIEKIGLRLSEGDNNNETH